jgi:hypothetical protein
VKLSALVLAVALGTSVGTAASNHDPNHAHKTFDRHEQVRNHDGERWVREHRHDQHRDLERERQQREAMHRWDREHHRRTVAVKHHEPKHEGWDRSKKTGWHGQRAPHGKYRRRYVKHPERHVSPANQQVMNRPPHDIRTAPVAR